MRTQSSRTALVVSFVMLMAVPLLAQTHFASFTGTITSRDGNPLADVEVVATNAATQVTYRARSNDRGLYTISALPIGTYKVRAQAPSFQAFETNAIRLESGQNARVDITMQLGRRGERRGGRRGPHPPDAGRRRGRGHLGDDHRGHAPQRAQLLPALAAAARRRHHRPRQLHRAQELRQRPSVRERPAGAGEQLHARRRRHERADRQPAALPAQPRRPGRGPGRDQQLFRRVRQRGGRGRRTARSSRAPTSSTATCSNTGATAAWPPTPGTTTA